MSTGNEYVRFLLNEGGNIPVDTEVNVDKIILPNWYDEKLFKKGQQYYTRNIFTMFNSMLCGLISVLAVPSILKVLICTNKSSTNFTAYRRYIRTIFHTVIWNWYSVDKNNLKSSKIFKSLLSVRRSHLAASKLCSQRKSGIISQKDMALTQFGFMGFTLLRAKNLGLNTKDTELFEATVHFWRVIGFMLGIKDEFNLCTDCWESTKQRLEAVVETVYRPALMETNKNFLEMTTALIEGLWSFNPYLTVETFLFFTRRLLGCEGHEYLKSDYKNEVDEMNGKKLYKNMKTSNRIKLFLMIYLMEYGLRCFLVRWFFSFQIYLSLFLIYYIPFLAWPRFGFKQSYVRLWKNS